MKKHEFWVDKSLSARIIETYVYFIGSLLIVGYFTHRFHFETYIGNLIASLVIVFLFGCGWLSQNLYECNTEQAKKISINFSFIGFIYVLLFCLHDFFFLHIGKNAVIYYIVSAFIGNFIFYFLFKKCAITSKEEPKEEEPQEYDELDIKIHSMQEVIKNDKKYEKSRVFLIILNAIAQIIDLFFSRHEEKAKNAGDYLGIIIMILVFMVIAFIHAGGLKLIFP